MPVYHILVSGLSQQTSKRDVGGQGSQEHVDEGAQTLHVKGILVVRQVEGHLPPNVVYQSLERSVKKYDILLNKLCVESAVGMRSNTFPYNCNRNGPTEFYLYILSERPET